MRKDDTMFFWRHERSVVYSAQEWLQILQQIAEQALSPFEQPTVLDAGCGSRCLIRFPAYAYVVGIDNCEEAIAQNTSIHEAIIGDLQAYPLPEQRFDLITLIDVLEHLPDPERALANTWRALKPGGTLLIRAPYLYSVKGLITKFTPHWVHVAFRRYILGDPNAGKPGYLPFKTFLRASMAPSKIILWAISNGGTVSHFYLRDGSNPYGLREKSRWAHILFRLIVSIPTILSLGCFQEYSDYMLAIRKGWE